MDRDRFPQIIQELYKLTAELEAMFPGRHFTPDGHLIGSIGEAIAKHDYGLRLLRASNKGHDATGDSLSVEIKTTGGKYVGLRHEPEHLLVLKIDNQGQWKEIYNGPGDIVWDLVREKRLPANGQYQISCATLKSMMKKIPAEKKIPKIVG